MRRFIIIVFLLGILPQFDNSFQTREQEASSTAKIGKLLNARFGKTCSFRRNFLYKKIDLNNDGTKEILVGLIGSEFCTNSGCTMLILNNKYAVLGSIVKVKYPVYIEQKPVPVVPNSYSNLVFYSPENYLKQIAWYGDSYQGEPITAKFEKLTQNEIGIEALNASEDPIYEF